MNTIQSIRNTITLLAISTTLVTTLAAQDKKADEKTQVAAAVKAVVDAQHYVFRAQTVTATGDLRRQLTDVHTVKVRKDTVEADLPYFGNTYSLSNSADAGIRFTSTQFEYQVKEKKKSWEVTIKPKTGDARQLSMTIFNDGTALLRVTSTNRQVMLFNGYVTD